MSIKDGMVWNLLKAARKREPAMEELGWTVEKSRLSLISLTKDALDSTVWFPSFFGISICKRKGKSTFNIKVSSQTGIRLLLVRG